MSSAILYLAIIAIWLCVLIPRWLKRDSARGAVIASDNAAGGETPVPRRRPTPTRQNSPMTARRTRPSPASPRASRPAGRSRRRG